MYLLVYVVLTLIEGGSLVVRRQPRIRRRDDGAFVIALDGLAINGKIVELLIEDSIVACVFPCPDAVLVPLEPECVELFVEVLSPEEANPPPVAL